MRRAAALALAFAAGPAAAFDIDYAAVMSDNADAVREVAPDRRELRLPPSILIIEQRASDGSLSHFGLDEGQHGAAGCLFGIVTDLAVLSGMCPDLLDEAAQARLSRALAEVALFAGTNAVPPVPSPDLPERLAERLSARRAAVRDAGAVCPGDPAAGAASRAESAALVGMLEHFSSPAFLDGLGSALGPARLPVANPCM